ncbi:MAG: hypothetical protein K0U98_00985 [Deltaproteobacteria bacterium]|nr:hypothetical protein [Deltaproteobacteria bacterium]
MKKVKWVLLVFAILSAAGAWTVQASLGSGVPIVVWVNSGDNSACTDPERLVCKEKCLRMPDGTEIPQGVFCCFPDTRTDPIGAGACEALRQD